MVTFDKVGTFLKQYGNPELQGMVGRFLNHFRKGKCYLHPFDNGGDHEYYFTSEELKIEQLFVACYFRNGDEVDSSMIYVCFDGENLGLIDLYTLLEHFLPYQQRFLVENEIDLGQVQIDMAEKLVDSAWLWAGFLVCKDHEGETSMAIYSQNLKPSEGLKLLHQNMVSRFLKPRPAA
jgi:hypothetical protein